MSSFDAQNAPSVPTRHETFQQDETAKRYDAGGHERHGANPSRDHGLHAILCNIHHFDLISITQLTTILGGFLQC